MSVSMSSPSLSMSRARERRYLGMLLAGSFIINLVTGLAWVPTAWYRYTINGVPEVDYTSEARPTFWDRNMDPNYYREHAEGLLRGHGYGGVGQAMPLYPIVLAGIIGVFGQASWPLLLLQAACGMTIVVFADQIARVVVTIPVCLLAGR